MKPFCLILALFAHVGLAARIETIALDLERPQQPFTLTLTEATDSTVSAQLRASGADFDASGCTGLLWYGTASGGLTITNETAGFGSMTWNLPVTSMPTNGRYSVQILGVVTNRTEEWGRGALSVRLNLARSSLPANWLAGDVGYIAATNALGVATQTRADLQAASNALATAIQALGGGGASMTNAYVRAELTNGVYQLFLITP